MLSNILDFKMIVLFCLNILPGSAIGVPVNEFDSIKDPQVVHFRRNILAMCMNVVEEREDQGKLGHALYAYPPNLEASEILPQHIMQKLNTGLYQLLFTRTTDTHS